MPQPVSSKASATDPIVPILLERIFLGLVIFLKILCCWLNRSAYIGYDIGDHLARVNDSAWWSPEPGIRAVYYGYHPPLGFLLPRLLFGWTDDSKIMATNFSTLCGIVALLFLRAALQKTRLLHTWPGFTFLYLWAGLPIIVNCGISLNLDLPLLATTAATLYFSIALFHKGGPATPARRVLIGCGLVLSLATGMMIKFSGLLSFSLPFLAVLAWSKDRRTISPWLRATLPCLLAAGLVLPYYYQRYYKTEGTFFPRNNVFFAAEDLEKAAAHRNANRAEFLLKLITPDFSHPAQARNLTELHLFDAWRDFFIRNDRVYFTGEDGPGKIPPGIVVTGRIYRAIFNLLVLAGVGFGVSSRFKNDSAKWGLPLAGLAGLFVLALVSYAWTEALPSYSPIKGIYILPLTWAVVWLAVYPLEWAMRNEKICGKILVHSLPILLAAWLIANHLWPVY